MQTSTRSAIGHAHGRLPVVGALARELAPVRVLGVAVRRGARVAHHLVAGRGVDRRVRLRRRRQESRERNRRRRLPHRSRVGLVAASPSMQTSTRLAKARSRNWPPRWQRARLELGQERRLERVEADQRVVVEQQRVGLDRARLGVHAGDRLRVDLVAEVGASRLAARGSSCRRTPGASRPRG